MQSLGEALKNGQKAHRSCDSNLVGRELEHKEFTHENQRAGRVANDGLNSQIRPKNPAVLTRAMTCFYDVT